LRYFFVKYAITTPVQHQRFAIQMTHLHIINVFLYISSNTFVCESAQNIHYCTRQLAHLVYNGTKVYNGKGYEWFKTSQRLSQMGLSCAMIICFQSIQQMAAPQTNSR